jgi:hypothetical protein
MIVGSAPYTVSDGTTTTSPLWFDQRHPDD